MIFKMISLNNDNDNNDDDNDDKDKEDEMTGLAALQPTCLYSKPSLPSQSADSSYRGQYPYHFDWKQIKYKFLIFLVSYCQSHSVSPLLNKHGSHTPSQLQTMNKYQTFKTQLSTMNLSIWLGLLFWSGLETEEADDDNDTQ